MRAGTGAVWQMSNSDFQVLIDESTTYSDALRRLGLRAAGSNHLTLKRRIDMQGLDVAHFRQGAHDARCQMFKDRSAVPLDLVMVESSTYSRASLKKRLLKSGVLQNVCSSCKTDGVWQGEPITMVLDHINGCHDDHRLENLRMLCPNCNSQQITFAGRKTQKLAATCSKCGVYIGRSSTTCPGCVDRTHTRRVERPPVDTLREQVNRLGWRGVARIYGVSDNAVRKWLK